MTGDAERPARVTRLPLAILAGMFAAGLAYYPYLPERIPTHWGPSGRVDAWADTTLLSVLTLPLVASALYAALFVLPRFDPRRRGLMRSVDSYNLVVDLLVGFMALLQAATYYAAWHPALPVDRVVIGALGLLFLAIGLKMPRVERNWTFGVRYSWTLEDEVVWRETNRLGGRIMVGSAVCAWAGALLGPPWTIALVLGPMVVLVATTYVYSLRLYRARHPEGGADA